MQALCICLKKQSYLYCQMLEIRGTKECTEALTCVFDKWGQNLTVELEAMHEDENNRAVIRDHEYDFGKNRILWSWQKGGKRLGRQKPKLGPHWRTFRVNASFRNCSWLWESSQSGRALVCSSISQERTSRIDSGTGERLSRRWGHGSARSIKCMRNHMDPGKSPWRQCIEDAGHRWPFQGLRKMLLRTLRDARSLFVKKSEPRLSVS